MLVISRAPKDQIVFPGLGITVEILKLTGSRASIGIDAPRDVRVIRHELVDESQTLPNPQLDSPRDSLLHEFRNRVNRATLKLQLASKMFTVGQIETGLATLSEGMSELSAANQGAIQQQKPADQFTLAEAKATFNESRATQRVLLVDDDENERALMASFLERCGMQVIEASDGLQALYRLAATDDVDVVLLDMNMPELDGPATVDRIRRCSSQPNVPIYAVTGESMEATGLSVSDNSVSGWFQKPVDVNEIVETISAGVAA